MLGSTSDSCRRLGALFNVVISNIKRARVSTQRGSISLEIDGSTAEIEAARDYLAALKVAEGTSASAIPPAPEDSIPRPNTILVRLASVNAEQAAAPLLARVAREITGL